MAALKKKGAKDALHIATSVRFEPPVKAAIDKAAKDDARSASSLIQKVMAEWLKAKGYLK
jgi:hypothetical protein